MYILSLGIFKLLKYRKYRYCYMLLCLLTNQSAMYVVWPSFQLKRDGFLLMALKKTFYWDKLLKYFFAFFFIGSLWLGWLPGWPAPLFYPAWRGRGEEARGPCWRTLFIPLTGASEYINIKQWIETIVNSEITNQFKGRLTIVWTTLNPFNKLPTYVFIAWDTCHNNRRQTS